MSEFSWIPGTVALAAGLLVGLFLALRLKRPAAAKKAGPAAHDLELRIADLEARRDDLYVRLRSEEEHSEAEVRALEHAAARTLRDLDAAQAELAQVRPKKARAKGKKQKAEPAAQGVPVAAGAGHHPFLWFLLGAGLMGLVGFLVFWAQQDAKPDPMAAQTTSPASGMPADHPEGLEGLSPDANARVASLEAQLEADPSNLAARKELAVLLAQHQQFFAAFQHAGKVLEVSPEDPDALYISSVTRLAMGEPETAIQLIDRVLVRFPEHVLGHLVKATALLQLQRRDEALASYRAGLQAAGGSNPEIERMIAAEFGAGVLEGRAPAGAPAASTPAPSPPVEDSGEPKVYRVYAEVAAGTVVPPGSSLFVSVHNPGGGPPAAVRAVRDPQFPVEVTLTQSDSNTGIPLPARGLIMIRLDSDGNPGTESPGDLVARGEGSSGELSKFVLW